MKDKFENMYEFEKAVNIYRDINLDFKYSVGTRDDNVNFYLKQIINNDHKYLNFFNLLQLLSFHKRNYFDVMIFVTDDSWLMISTVDFQEFLKRCSISNEILEKEKCQCYSGSIVEFPKTPIFINVVSEELFALMTLNLMLNDKGGFIYG